jgi:glycerol-3-phosphate acyltransferase PlsY
VWLPIAYFAGSVPFGVLAARVRGVDLKQVGSGNIGATNVARALGWRWGIPVLFLDALKSFLPIWLARRSGLSGERGEWMLAATALLAVLGHVFPPWLRFRGGKGVASAMGAFAALTPLSVCVAIAVFLGIYALTRTVSVGSLVASLALVVTVYVRHEPVPNLLLAGSLFSLILWRHRENIRRLVRRQENKV